jgi:hypothetical protein
MLVVAEPPCLAHAACPRLMAGCFCRNRDAWMHWMRRSRAGAASVRPWQNERANVNDTCSRHTLGQRRSQHRQSCFLDQAHAPLIRQVAQTPSVRRPQDTPASVPGSRSELLLVPTYTCRGLSIVKVATRHEPKRLRRNRAPVARRLAKMKRVTLATVPWDTCRRSERCVCPVRTTDQPLTRPGAHMRQQRDATRRAVRGASAPGQLRRPVGCSRELGSAVRLRALGTLIQWTRNLKHSCTAILIECLFAYDD